MTAAHHGYGVIFLLLLIFEYQGKHQMDFGREKAGSSGFKGKARKGELLRGRISGDNFKKVPEAGTF